MLEIVKSILGGLEIFINLLNWALPALAIIGLFVGLPIFIVWYLLVGKKKHNSMWLLKRVLIFPLVLIVVFVIYGLIQFIGALFGIDSNRATNISNNNQSETTYNQ